MAHHCAIIFGILIASIQLVGAAEYWVSVTNGSNANPGTEAQPWKNVYHAAVTAVAGDTVTVRAGFYNESVTNTASGLPGQPITFTGERGGSGEWLTIIDSSMLITNAWSAATEIGAGVWKQTGLPFETKELSIGTQRVAFVFTTNYLGANNLAFYQSPYTNGSQILTLPTDATVDLIAGVSVSFWDGIKAMWAATNGTTYLRLRDGSDPSSLEVRINRCLDGLWHDWPYQGNTIQMVGKSNIVWKNFHVTGGFTQFLLDTGAADNIIESNRIERGWYRVYGQDNVTRNIVRNNQMTCNFYGYTNQGAWTGRQTEKAKISDVIYRVSKYYMGQTSQGDYDMRWYLCGDSNLITGNTCWASMGNGIFVSTISTEPMLGTQISSNVVSGHPSAGILHDPFPTETHIYDNNVSDCDGQFRVMRMNAAGQTDQVIYFYRNRCWLPSGEGDQIYLHLDFTTTNATYFPELWVYNNSFSGGEHIVNSSFYDYDNGGWKGLRFINNILSGSLFLETSKIGMITNANYMGAWDYNLNADVNPTNYNGVLPAWWGSSNIIQASLEWATNDTALALAPGSSAINNALDVAQDFVLRGTNYTALPNTAIVKTGLHWDIGALEHSGAMTGRGLILRGGSIGQ